MWCFRIIWSTRVDRSRLRSSSSLKSIIHVPCNGHWHSSEILKTNQRFQIVLIHFLCPMLLPLPELEQCIGHDTFISYFKMYVPEKRSLKRLFHSSLSVYLQNRMVYPVLGLNFIFEKIAECWFCNQNSLTNATISIRFFFFLFIYLFIFLWRKLAPHKENGIHQISRHIIETNVHREKGLKHEMQYYTIMHWCNLPRLVTGSIELYIVFNHNRMNAI